jgi:lipoprotein-releasing system ATP-binding protein
MLPGLKLEKYSNAELEQRAMGHLKTLGKDV